MSTGLSRVTIVAPRTRVDLALPSDVPLADLLPTVLAYAGGELVEDPAARNWTLSRLGGAGLDSTLTPAQLQVFDGELLFLRPRGEDAPRPVFDDVADAVATATRQRPGRWADVTTRRFGLTLGAVALLGGALVILLAGPPYLPGALVGLGLAAALLVGAVLLARALGDPWSATALALVASVYAAVGGLLLFAGDRTLGGLAGAHVLVSATAFAVATAVAAVGVADSAPVFLCNGLCALAVVAITEVVLVFDARPAAAAAIVVTVALATLPLLPMFAYRLAKLPIPSMPTEREHLRQDTETVDGPVVLSRSGRAESFLAGLLGALAAVTAGAAVLLAAAGGWSAVLCVVLGLLLMARARWFLGRAQRLPLLLAGGVALGAAAVAGYQAVDQVGRLTWILGTAWVVAGLAIGFGLAGARRGSPVWGRLLDIGEIILILAVAPLAVWVSGLFDWTRSIRG